MATTSQHGDGGGSSDPRRMMLVAGVWSRLWEEDPLLMDSAGDDTDKGSDDEKSHRVGCAAAAVGGDRSTVTLVLWTQTPSGMYVDVRIPRGAPGRSLRAARQAGYRSNPAAILGMSTSSSSSSSSTSSTHERAMTTTTTTQTEAAAAAAMTTTPTKDLEFILQQKSFAGYLTLTLGDTTDGTALRKDPILAAARDAAADAATKRSGMIPLCTCVWRREIDFQPPSGGALDVGLCVTTTPDDDSNDADDADDNNGQSRRLPLPIHHSNNDKNTGMDINNNENHTTADDDDDDDDAGSMPYDLLMRETGADGSYAEGWGRLRGTVGGPFLAMELIASFVDDDGNGNNTNTGSTTTTATATPGGRKGYWVRAGNGFAYAVGRPTTAASSGDEDYYCHPTSCDIASCAGKTLAEAMESSLGIVDDDDGDDGDDGGNDSKLELAMSYVAVAGIIVNEKDDDDASSSSSSPAWRILCSTQAELVGCNLVGGTEARLCCSTLRRRRHAADKNWSSGNAQTMLREEEEFVEQTIRVGGGRDNVVRVWRIVEISGCDLPL